MKISVVVISYNKAYELGIVLSGLLNQSISKNDFEVIVVDDGSVDETMVIADSYRDKLNIKLAKYCHTGQRAFLRNEGAKLATGEIITFIDSDIICAPNYLSRIADRISDDASLVLLGRRINTAPFDRAYLSPRDVLTDYNTIRDLPGINDERTLAFEVINNGAFNNDCMWTLAFSHGIALSGSLFARSEGFDPDFSKKWGVEDVEFGYRLFQLGAKIEILDIEPNYHIYHEANLLDKIDDLKENLGLFAAKHVDYKTELFALEYSIWACRYHAIVSGIRKFIIGDKIKGQGFKVPNTNSCITFGLPQGAIASDNQVIALMPSDQQSSVMCINKIGIKTTFKDKEFECAIINQKYQEVDGDLFDLIQREAVRVSKDVYAIDTENGALIRLQRHDDKKFRILISRATEYSSQVTVYYYLKLLEAFERNGWNVSIEYPYNPFNEYLPRKDAFLYSNESFLHYCKDFSMYEDEITTIIDTKAVASTQRAAGNRIWWDVLDYGKSEKKNLKDVSRMYRQIIPMSDYDKTRIEDAEITCSTKIAPGAVELNLRKEYNGSEKFKFILIEPFVNAASNIIEAIQAFANVIKANDCAAELVLYLQKGNYKFFDNPYFNDGYRHLLRSSIQSVNHKANEYYAECIKLASNLDNVTVIECVDEYRDIFDFSAGNACFLDVAGKFTASPWVLDMYASGIKSVIVNPKAYSEYFSTDKQICIGSSSSSCVILEPLPESTWGVSASCVKYMRYMKPISSDLEASMKMILSNRSILNVSEEDKMAFRSEHGWDSVFQKFIKFMELR